MKLCGSVAAVTGAGAGIGRAISLRLASMGAHVVVADIDQKAAEETARLIQETHAVKAIALRSNAASKQDNLDMVTAAVEQFGRLDILVCNAGIVAKSKPIEDMEEEEWDRFLSINLKGPIFATQAAAPVLKRQKSGTIIYISSVGGQVGGVTASVAYAVTKAGVLCLTKSMAKQLAPYGVRVNAVAPGTIQTNMTDILQYDEQTLASIPLKRIGDVEDIAGAVAYLASTDAAYITGAVIDVNGGMFMR